jgi:hypothetical protein
MIWLIIGYSVIGITLSMVFVKIAVDTEIFNYPPASEIIFPASCVAVIWPFVLFGLFIVVWYKLVSRIVDILLTKKN